jgi:hypothetical protein
MSSPGTARQGKCVAKTNLEKQTLKVFSKGALCLEIFITQGS